MNIKTLLMTVKSYDKIRGFLASVSSFLLLMATGVMMAFLSWKKWPDVLVDFGRELYVPWQLNNGSVLYKDILHLFGPLSHYFNSWLFKIFGTQLLTLAIFNIVLVAVLTYFIYYIFLLTTDRLVATLTGVTFLSVFAFSQYGEIGNYNFVCPYSYELTHGIFLSFFSIFTFFIYLKQRKPSLIGMLGIALGLVSLTKVEVFIAISLAILTGLILITWINKLTITRILKLFAIFSLGFILPIIVFVVYFSGRTSLKEAMSFLILPYKVLITSSILSNIFSLRILGSTIFSLRILGIDTPFLNLSKMFIMTAWYIVILIIFLSLSYLVNQIQNKKIRRYTISVILAVFILSAPLIVNGDAWMDICRPLPIVMAALGTYLFISLLHCRNNSQETIRLLPLLVLTVFAFALLFKMILNVHVFHYGFALSMPAALLLVMLLLYQFPLLSGKLSGNTNFVRASGLILISIAIASHISITGRIYNLKTYTIGSDGDTIITFSPQVSNMGPVMNDVLLKIKGLLKQDDTFVVLPEGVMLNYLTRRKNPSPYFEFTPPVVEMLGEDTIIDSLREKSPDYIILTDKDTSECGYRYFGQDYGLKIFSWIKNHYIPICRSGNMPLSGEGFGVIIAKRKINTAP